MYCQLQSCALLGVDGLIIDVEIDIDNGLPSFDIVGLPDSSVREAKDRVRSAIKNSGFNFPIKRITVNLAPADYKKEGAHYDLPIALGILCCMGVISQQNLENKMIAGELALDGSVRCLKGVLPMISKANSLSLSECIIPFDNLKQANLIDSILITGTSSLKETVSYLKGEILIINNTLNTLTSPQDTSYQTLDFSDIKGQENGRRAMEIAAAGKHNVIIIGPPGSGKTMLANRILTILPPLSKKEIVDVNKIYSVCNQYDNSLTLSCCRPFRSPHHTTTISALIGGGKNPVPGEISLAHHGVLFLDELLEFKKKVLETLRQPLETHTVTISRVNAVITYPSDFILIAATNPCPCGFYPDSQRCSCSSQSIYSYIKKLSGPLLDRIDIHVETNAIPYNKLKSKSSEESSSIKQRVAQAIKIQSKRYKNEPFKYNSQLPSNLIDKYCYLGASEETLLIEAFENLNLSARSYHKIIRLSRTIADLDLSENIHVNHLSEAIQYRVLDKNYNN